MIGIGPKPAQRLLIGAERCPRLVASTAALCLALMLTGCASPQEAEPPPPSAILGGIEPPPGFDPYLTPQQRAEQALAARQVPIGPEYAGDPAGQPESAPPPLAGLPEPPPAAVTQQAIAQAEASNKWSIVLVAFRGEQAEAAAVQGLQRVEAAGVRGAYLERRGQSIALAVGRFDAADDPAALQTLAQLQAMEIEGGRPFAGAVLAPPSPDLLKGSVPEYDLRTVKQRFGDDALYTLQVAVYGRADREMPEPAELAEYRQAAERAVYELRREGEQAFYYHAPVRSMVTIGVLGPEDHDPMVPGIESQRLRELRLRHPHNLLNGQGIRQRVPGRPANDPDAWQLQPSALVGVP